jgi:hypothetical protein
LKNLKTHNKLLYESNELANELVLWNSKMNKWNDKVNHWNAQILSFQEMQAAIDGLNK